MKSAEKCPLTKGCLLPGSVLNIFRFLVGEIFVAQPDLREDVQFTLNHRPQLVIGGS